MRLTRLLSLLTLTLLAGPVSGEDELIAQVRHEFAGVLHPLQQLAPGYKRPSTPAPTFAVGEFQTDDDALRTWSFAIAEILRWRIQYVPTVRVTMPSAYYTALDAGVDNSLDGPLLTLPEHFQGLHDALGIKTVLTGVLDRNGDQFIIDAELVNSASGEQAASAIWRATAEQLPAALIELSSWVYDELGVQLGESERAYLKDAETIKPAAIAAFVENYEALNTLDLDVRQDLLEDLRKAHPKFALFMLYALHAKAYPTNLKEARENLLLSEQSRAQFPDHAGVNLESYRTTDLNSQPEEEAEKRLNGLRDLVVANPHDPMIMINFANAYGEQDDILEALSLAIEIAERWPDNYRSWWGLGWQVSRYAWQVRGVKMWSEVPRAARERFQLLSFLSDTLIDKALAMHDRNGALWVMKLSGIGSTGGYSPELMAAFEAAAVVAPTHEPVYATTLNFSQNKWGGNAAARRRVIELAEKNNPDADWPKFMRSMHQADFEGLKGFTDAVKDEIDIKGLPRNPAFWKLIFVLIFAALSAYLYASVRRAKIRVPGDPSDDTNQPGWDNGAVRRRELSQEEMLEQVRRTNRGH